MTNERQNFTYSGFCFRYAIPLSELRVEATWLCPVCRNMCECSKCKKALASSTKKSPHLRLGGRGSGSSQTEIDSNGDPGTTSVQVGADDKSEEKLTVRHRFLSYFVVTIDCDRGQNRW